MIGVDRNAVTHPDFLDNPLKFCQQAAAIAGEIAHKYLGTIRAGEQNQDFIARIIIQRQRHGLIAGRRLQTANLVLFVNRHKERNFHQLLNESFALQFAGLGFD